MPSVARFSLKLSMPLVFKSCFLQKGVSLTLGLLIDLGSEVAKWDELHSFLGVLKTKVVTAKLSWNYQHY